MDTFDRPRAAERFEHRTHATVGRHLEPVDQGRIRQRFVRSLGHPFPLGFVRTGQWPWVSTSLLKRRPGFQEGLLEVATDGHHLPRGFH